MTVRHLINRRRSWLPPVWARVRKNGVIELKGIQDTMKHSLLFRSSQLPLPVRDAKFRPLQPNFARISECRLWMQAMGRAYQSGQENIQDETRFPNQTLQKTLDHLRCVRARIIIMKNDSVSVHQWRSLLNQSNFQTTKFFTIKHGSNDLTIIQVCNGWFH